MIHYLKLVRYPNLLLLIVMQLIIRYGFLFWQNIPLALNHFEYLLLVASTVFIAAAGYVINDICDQETDIINKPKQLIIGKSIAISTAYNFYIALNCLGVGLGFYLANVIQKPGLASLFIAIAALLYLYANSLKQLFLVGNLVVAALLSFSVIIIGFFDLYPIITASNQAQISNLFSILLDYAWFAFMINFLRELTKDIEDYEGDFENDMKTIPIVLGINTSNKLVLVLSCIPIATLLYYAYEYFFLNNLQLATLYTLLVIVGSLFYFSAKLFTAKTSTDYRHLSTLLKLVLLFGIFLIPIVTFTIIQNA